MIAALLAHFEGCDDLAGGGIVACDLLIRFVDNSHESHGCSLETSQFSWESALI